MAGYQFRTSGVKFANGFNDIPVQMYFEEDLFNRAQDLLEDLAEATGHMDGDQKGLWPTGSFCVVIERDHDGNGLVGLLPAAPINDDTKNQPTEV